MKYVSILFIFLTAMTSSFAQTHKNKGAVYIDQFESMATNGITMLNGYWYSYNDNPNNGASAIQYRVFNDRDLQSKVIQLHYQLDKGTSTYEAYVGAGCTLSADQFPNGAQAIAYQFKGGQHTFIYNTKDILDYACYQKKIPASEDWITVVIPFSDLTQPEWGTKEKLNATEVNSLVWQITGKTGDGGVVSIDNIRFLYKPTIDSIPEASRTVNAWTIEADSATLSPQQYKEDFQQLTELLETHPAVNTFTTAQAFKALETQQAATIKEGMTQQDFYNAATPLVAAVKCGHTQLLREKGFINDYMLVFPLKIYAVGDKVYVLENYSANQEVKPGSEIVSINGESIQTIFSNLEAKSSSDAGIESAKRAWLNRNFPFYYRLYYPASDAFQVVTKTDPEARAKEFKVPAISLKKWNSQFIWDAPMKGLKVNKEKNVAVMTISSFSYYTEGSRMLFFNFIDTAFARLKKEGISNLMVDLRNNSGGDPFCGEYLLSYLLPNPFVYFKESSSWYDSLKTIQELSDQRYKGNLVVLINGRSFSTTGHVCSLLKYYKTGIFVGEETGGTYTCNDGKKDHILKNTRLVLTLPEKTFSTAVEGISNAQGILPDYPVVPSIEDQLNDKDVVLLKGYELLGVKK
ncbi:MAG: peptidase family [Chitinophagaceae bacterium]|nr:peptidase family [Chitinophagaceae bacterium]